MLEKYKNLSFFERIMELREIFAKRQIVGTGSGKASRRDDNGFREEEFEFVQLSDFLPEAEIRCKDLGLTPIVCLEGAVATMTVYDELSDKTVAFTTPTCPIRTTGNGQALQALGAQISYSRRYLWYLFLDLCTHDELDEGLYDAGLPQKRSVPSVQQPTPLTVSQMPKTVAKADDTAGQEAKTSDPVTEQADGQQNEKPPREKDSVYTYLLKAYVQKIMVEDVEGIFKYASKYGITPQLVEEAEGVPIDAIDIDTIRTTVLTNINEIARRKNS